MLSAFMTDVSHVHSDHQLDIECIVCAQDGNDLADISRSIGVAAVTSSHAAARSAIVVMFKPYPRAIFPRAPPVFS
jgi:hypothetical protein